MIAKAQENWLRERAMGKVRDIHNVGAEHVDLAVEALLAKAASLRSKRNRAEADRHVAAARALDPANFSGLLP